MTLLLGFIFCVCVAGAIAALCNAKDRRKLISFTKEFDVETKTMRFLVKHDGGEGTLVINRSPLRSDVIHTHGHHSITFYPRTTINVYPESEIRCILGENTSVTLEDGVVVPTSRIQSIQHIDTTLTTEKRWIRCTDYIDNIKE